MGPCQMAVMSDRKLETVYGVLDLVMVHAGSIAPVTYSIPFDLLSQNWLRRISSGLRNHLRSPGDPMFLLYLKVIIFFGERI